MQNVPLVSSLETNWPFLKAYQPQSGGIVVLQVVNVALQRQNAVTAYLKRDQILYIGLSWQT